MRECQRGSRSVALEDRKSALLLFRDVGEDKRDNFGNRRMLKQPPQLELSARDPFNFGDHPNGEERVTTEIEEVVVHPNALHAQ